MENLLNLCWGVLALAALVDWRCQATRARRSTPQLVALLCVLALMLPVISATDDLHPTAQAIEDSSKRTQQAWAAMESVTTHIKYGSPPAVLVLAPMTVPYAGSVEWLRPPAAPSLQAGSTLSGLWRAPPALTF